MERGKDDTEEDDHSEKKPIDFDLINKINRMTKNEGSNLARMQELKSVHHEAERVATDSSKSKADTVKQIEDAKSPNQEKVIGKKSDDSWKGILKSLEETIHEESATTRNMIPRNKAKRSNSKRKNPVKSKYTRCNFL